MAWSAVSSSHWHARARRQRTAADMMGLRGPRSAFAMICLSEDDDAVHP